MFRKLIDHIKGKPELMIGLLPIIAILLVFRSSLLDGMFNNGDVLYNAYNYFSYYARGGPIIAQSILSGFPVFSSVAGIWFYPLNDAFARLFGAFHGYVFLDVANIIAAYGLSYAYARALRLSKWSSILAAAVFVFSGQLTVWSETADNTNYYFLLPAALLCAEWIFRSGKARCKWSAALLLGIVMGAGWLSGHVQYVVYIHVFVAAYWLVRAWPAAWRSLGGWLAFMRKSVPAACAYAVSYIVGYPQIRAVLDMRAFSVRSSGVRLSDYWAGAFMPQDMIHYLLPFFSLPFMPFANPNLYIGIIPLLLLILGFVFWKKIAAAAADKVCFYIFGWSFIFSLICSFKYSPVGVILHYLPLFDSFQEAPRIMFLGDFAAALLVGFALDFIVANKDMVAARSAAALKWGRLVFLRVFLPLSLIASILAMFFTGRISSALTSYFLTHRYSASSALPKSAYAPLIRGYVSQALGQCAIYSKDMIILAVFCVLAYLLFKKMGRMSGRAFALSALCLSIANLYAVYEGRFSSIPEALYDKAPASAEYISAQIAGGLPARAYTILPGRTLFEVLGAECPDAPPGEGFALASELLLPNRNMDFNIDALSGYDNFMPARVSELLDYVGSEQSVTGAALANADMSIADKVAVIASRKDMLRAMNTRYVISHYPISDPDFVEAKSWDVGACDTVLHLYELKGYWPRYFLSDSYVPLEPGTSTELAAFIDEASRRAGPFAAIDEADAGSLAIASSSGPDPQSAGTRSIVPVSPSYGYDSMSFSVNAAGDSLLFVGNAFLPGYAATIDGVPAKIYRANYAYMAIEVSSGKHSVVFSYKVPSRTDLFDI